MFRINTIIEPHYPVRTKFLRSIASLILELMKVKGSTEVSLLIVGDRKMRGLNRSFAGLDSTTDVLSFSGTEKTSAEFINASKSKYLNLGDIAISYPQAINNAIKDNVLVDTAIAKLVIHGLLHLLGYDHAKPAEEMSMKKLEEQILYNLYEQKVLERNT